MPRLHFVLFGQFFQQHQLSSFSHTMQVHARIMLPSMHARRALFSPLSIPTILSTCPVSIASTRASSSSSKTHARPSSSAQPTSTATVPSTSSTASNSLDNINPPPSTRPADLNLPDPASADATVGDKAKRYVALGRAYLSFYKTGLKNVYHNYRTSLPLRRELGVIPVYLPVSPPPKPSRGTRTGAGNVFRTAVYRTRLSRSNFQLIRRAAYDIRRMIPFTLMLMICGEFTPLIVLAIGSAVVPATCRVPKQVAKDRAQKAARKRAALVAQHVQDTGSVSLPRQQPENKEAGGEYGAELDLLATRYADPVWIEEQAAGEEVLRASAALGLVRTHARPAVLGSVVYRARLRRFAEYLAVDDGLIRRAGGVSAMEAVEVRLAVEERGAVELVHGVEEGWEAEREQRRWLDAWLERREGIMV